MDLTFNQVEAVFTRRFDMPESKAVAFRGRLQHLQRLNFPTGVNTGRGTKARYGWIQIIQLMMVLDLIDVGLTPDVAAKSVKKSTDELVDAICEIISSFEGAETLARAVRKARCPSTLTRIVIVSTFALTYPRSGGKEALFEILTSAGFANRLLKDPAVEPAGAFVNLGSRMMLVAQIISGIVGVDLVEVAIDLLSWGRDTTNENNSADQ